MKSLVLQTEPCQTPLPMSSQPSSVPTLPFQHPVVTGATGFIGSHLLEALTTRPGLEIKAIVRRRSKRVWLAKQNAEVREVDFSQASSWATAIAGADVVFHLAGATAGTVSQLQKANRDNTTALMEACAQQPRPPVVVLVSSVSAGGPSLPHRLRSPAEPAAPLSNYGKSKLAGELAALQFANRVPLTIVRPGIVFGPRDTELVRLLPLITRLGIHPVPGWNDPLISFIHVTDLVDLLIRAAERGQRCAALNPRMNRAGESITRVIRSQFRSAISLAVQAKRSGNAGSSTCEFLLWSPVVPPWSRKRGTA